MGLLIGFLLAESNPLNHRLGDGCGRVACLSLLVFSSGGFSIVHVVANIPGKCQFLVESEEFRTSDVSVAALENVAQTSYRWTASWCLLVSCPLICFSSAV